MRNALYVRFGLFAAFVLDSLRGVGGRERFESSNVAFAAQAVGLETMRAASAFEDPHMRLRNGRLIRLSSEFMAMNTRFHALHQLLERLRAQGSTQVLEAFEPCLRKSPGCSRRSVAAPSPTMTPSALPSASPTAANA